MKQQHYPVYKGLQKPLIYKGLKGRFIYWGIGTVVASILLGGILGALSNMYLGCLAMAIITAAGLCYTIIRQKGGLYDKTRHKGIFIHPIALSISNETAKKDHL